VSRASVRPKTRWGVDFKLRALARMEDAPDVTALALELGCRREQLYVWRRKYLAGGVAALQMLGRPRLAPPAADAPPPSAMTTDTDPRRIAALERKIVEQQLDLDFFRAALRQVEARRPPNDGAGATASTRRSTR